MAETDFGQRLRALRLEKGWSQVTLAARTGLHSQSIVKLERGDRKPNWETVQILALALGVEVTAFRDPSLGLVHPLPFVPPTPEPIQPATPTPSRTLRVKVVPKEPPPATK